MNKLTDQGLQYLNGVHTINLSYCRQITDQGLQYLTDKSAITSGKLKGVHILIYQCNQLTDQSLQYLAEPALTYQVS